MFSPAQKAVLDRVRAEYLEMPGMRLQVEQVSRLFGVDGTVCQTVLDSLVDSRFLCVKRDGAYARLTDGDDSPHPRSAKALMASFTLSRRAS